MQTHLQNLVNQDHGSMVPVARMRGVGNAIGGRGKY